MPPNQTSGVVSILHGAGRHWVGDGFPVRMLFAYAELGPLISLFLLLDYPGPVEFPATQQSLGVGPHPHRGFETVTIVYSAAKSTIPPHRGSKYRSGTSYICPGVVDLREFLSGVIGNVVR